MENSTIMKIILTIKIIFSYITVIAVYNKIIFNKYFSKIFNKFKFFIKTLLINKFIWVKNI